MKVKIKRFCKRVLPVVIAVMALAAAFCVPVSAASAGWTDISLGYEDFFDSYTFSNEDLQLDVFNLSSGRSFWIRPGEFLSGHGQPVNQHPYTGIKYYMDTSFGSGYVSVGDELRCTIPLGSFGGYELLPGDDFFLSIAPFRVGLGTDFADLHDVSFGIKYEYSDGTFSYKDYPILDELISSPGAGNYYWQSLGISQMISKPCKVYIDYVDITFTVLKAINRSVAVVFPEGVEISYGNPDSPEAPKYDTPDGSFIEDYTEKEEEVLNSTQDGQDEFNSLLANFRTVMNKFGPSMLAATWVFNLLLDEFALSYFLLYFALLTGVAAFILGISSWIGRGTRSTSSKGSKGKKGG